MVSSASRALAALVTLASLAASCSRRAAVSARPRRVADAAAQTPRRVGAPPFDRLSAGTTQTCAVARNGELWCWGSNQYGELATGDRRKVSGPVLVRGLPAVARVSAAWRVTMALGVDGSVWRWGSGGAGDGPFAPASEASWAAEVMRPKRVALVGRVRDLAATSLGFCARTDDGSVRCRRHAGPDDTGDTAATPVVSGLERAERVSLGPAAGCAITADARLFCWSLAAFVQADLAPADARFRAFAVPVPGHVVDVALTSRRACAVTDAGSLHCWENVAEPPRAVTQVAIEGVVAVGLRINGACVARRDGSLACEADGGAFVALPFGGRANALASGDLHNCALTHDGAAWCWGDDHHAQLGRPERQLFRSEFRAVEGVHDAIDVAHDVYDTCALLRSGSLACWGGRVHTPGAPTGVLRARAAPVAGIEGATSLAMSRLTACVALRDGSVRCRGVVPEVGVTAADGPWRPVAGVTDARAIALGDRTLAVRIEQGWYVGTLTPGATPRSPLTLEGVARVPGAARASVAVGDEHLCLASEDAGVACMGRTLAGALGTGSLTDSRAQPAAVAQIEHARAVATGGVRTCAIDGAGAPWCWGAPPWGIDGATRSEYARAARASGVADARGVTVGRAHLCTWNARGDFACVRDAPGVGYVHGDLAAGALRGVRAAAAGECHVCAVTVDGAVRCAGCNPAGELGDGVALFEETPRRVTW